MNTRRALGILSKGDRVYEDRSNGDMQGRSKHFLDMFEERERQIMAKQNAESVPMPFLETIKRKVAKLVSAPNTDMPVVTRFDLYTGIRKMSLRAPADQGMKRLASQLERAWHAEPLGTLSYGQVSGLVSLFRDQHPRSKAADAIEAECTRVGMHKLPVAKLARIASVINTQEDYDQAMESAGYGGTRPEQIRARALVRELVALRGADVDSHDSKKADHRDLNERVASHVEAQMVPPQDDEMAMNPLAPKAPGMSQQAPGMSGPMDPALAGDGQIQQQDIEQGADLVQQIDDMAQEVVQDAPPQAMDYIQHEMSEGHTAPPGTAEWGAEEILNEGHEAPPPSEEWLNEELAEMGMGGEVGMGMDQMPAGEGAPVMKPMQAAKGKGIPLPEGKIKQQPNADSPENLDLPKDGGKVLKASEIEESLLEGKTVKIGSCSILVNDDMEVELWQKDAGRACDLLDMDTAISDFINMVNDERHIVALSKFAFSITPLVHVPCESCASVTLFPLSKNASDVYGCECGHRINASSVSAIMKFAGAQQAYQLQVSWVPQPDPTWAKQQREGIHKTISQSTGGAKIDDEGRGYLTATLWGIDEFQLKKIERDLGSFGGQPESRRVAEEAAVHAAQLFGEDSESDESDSDESDNSESENPFTDGDDSDSEAPESDGPPEMEMDDEQDVTLTIKIPKADLANAIADAESAPDEMAPEMEMVEMSAPDMGAPDVGPPAQPAGLFTASMKRLIAQATPPMAPPGGPLSPASPAAAPAQNGQNGDDAPQFATDMPMTDVIRAAMTNYKAQGMALPEALRTFFKEHGDLIEARWDDSAAKALMDMQLQLWSGSVPAAGAPPAPAAPAAGAPPMPMAAQKVLEPAVKKKPKDQVSLPSKPLGKDTTGDDLLPSPGKIKQQQGKPDGKLSPTDLGKDSDGREIELAKPKKTSPTKGKLPNKDMGRDSEGDEGFKVPGQGAKPSVSKK